MILGIDTALSGCSVSLLDGSRQVDAMFELVHRGHAERLPPMIAALLDAHPAARGDIDTVAVAVGPGSFTGIRVGLAAARALALAWQARCVGVSSLMATAAAAFAASPDAASLMAAIDASRGQVYAQPFARNDGGLMALAAPRVLAPEEAADWAVATRCPAVAGSGAALVAAILPALAVLPPEWTDAAWIARLAPDASAALAPRALYIRPHDARPMAVPSA